MASGSLIDRRGINRFLSVVPIIFSMLALAIVVGNVVVGARTQPDEGTWAHLFQLLIAGQLPLVLLFIVTADWARPREPILVMLVQALTCGAALGSLAWAGY